MHHGGWQVVAVVLEDLQQTLVGIALMEKHRKLQFDGQGQVFFEDFFLLGARGEVPVEIQPAFTHGAHSAVAQ